MKKVKSLVLGLVLILATAAKAQVSVNVNIGSPPQWGPVGYTDVRYYYLPDVEAYYDIETAMFIYYGGGVWVHKTQLPSRYAYFDLYDGYKVVLTGFHANNPYVHFHDHKVKYKKGYKGKAQKTIGMKPGKGNKGGSSGNAKNSHSGGQKSSGGNKNSGNTKSGGSSKQSGGQQNKGGSGSTKSGGGNKGQKGGGGKGK